jgi:hypothetical protein
MAYGRKISANTNKVPFVSTDPSRLILLSGGALRQRKLHLRLFQAESGRL